MSNIFLLFIKHFKGIRFDGETWEAVREVKLKDLKGTSTLVLDGFLNPESAAKAADELLRECIMEKHVVLNEDVAKE